MHIIVMGLAVLWGGPIALTGVAVVIYLIKEKFGGGETETAPVLLPDAADD